MSSARVLSRLALAEAPSTAIIVTSETPIIRADAVAAVRRGLRRVFCSAIRPTAPKPAPVDPAQPGEHRPAEHRAEQGGADEHAEGAGPEHVGGLGPHAEQPGGHAGDADGEQHRTHGEPPPQTALGEGHVVAHGRDRGNAAGPSRGQVGGGERDEHADDEADDDRAGLEHQRVLAEVEAEPPEDRLDPDGEQHAEADAEGRPDESHHAGLEQHRARHLAPAGADRAQQGELAAALGDEDREGVDDEEGAHRQGDAREHEEEGRDERQRLVDASGGAGGGVVTGRGLGVRRQHRGDGVAQLLLAGAGCRGHPDLREGVLALEEQVLRLRGVEHDDARADEGRPAERGGADADVASRRGCSVAVTSGTRLTDEVAGLLRRRLVEHDLALAAGPAAATRGSPRAPRWPRGRRCS